MLFWKTYKINWIFHQIFPYYPFKYFPIYELTLKPLNLIFFFNTRVTSTITLTFSFSGWKCHLIFGRTILLFFIFFFFALSWVSNRNWLSFVETTCVLKLRRTTCRFPLKMAESICVLVTLIPKFRKTLWDK